MTARDSQCGGMEKKMVLIMIPKHPQTERLRCGNAARPRLHAETELELHCEPHGIARHVPMLLFCYALLVDIERLVRGKRSYQSVINTIRDLCGLNFQQFRHGWSGMHQEYSKICQKPLKIHSL